MVGIATGRQRRSLFSSETRLAFAPSATYPLLLAEPPVPIWRRLGLIVLVIAVAIPIMALQRVTIGLVAVTAMSWIFVLAIQLVLGALVIASVRSRHVTLGRALDLWFAGHLPYSLWLLASAALMSSLRFGSVETVIALGVIPSAWTAILVSAFCRVALGTSRRGARWRAAIHFAAVWVIGLQYVAWTAGGWFQVTGSITRFVE